jgi:tRNA1(Val) A37 N6-methylase TrmN6
VSEFLVFDGELDGTLGQVWTPSEIAERMIQLLSPYVTHESEILDPAAGPGTFTSALLRSNAPFKAITNYEIDERLNELLVRSLLGDNVTLIKENFLTHSRDSKRFDIAILNPPYIRHEAIDAIEKEFLINEMARITSRHFTRRMNYFGYFLVWSAHLLKPSGILCAIVYDSLQSTKYGQELIEYFDANGVFLHRETISAPFQDTLVDAEILVWQKNDNQSIPPLEMQFEISPATTQTAADGFCFVSDLATVKRGTSFLKREYFIRTEKSDSSPLKSIITKQSLTQGLIAEPNAYALFKSDSPERDLELLRDLRKEFESEQLDNLKSLPVPVTGPILFNYYLRDKVRHLLNTDELAASDNFYCISPIDPDSAMIYWVIANSTQAINALLKNSRAQGSGLRKLQLFEYSSAEFPDYRNFTTDEIERVREIGIKAIEERWSYELLRSSSTTLLVELGYECEA